MLRRPPRHPQIRPHDEHDLATLIGSVRLLIVVLEVATMVSR